MNNVYEEIMFYECYILLQAKNNLTVAWSIKII